VSQTPVSSICCALASLIGSFGAVFLELGAEPMRRGFLHIFNLKLAAGIALFLGSSVPFIMGLKHGELSVLYPLVSLVMCGRFSGRSFSSMSRLRGRRSRHWR